LRYQLPQTGGPNLISRGAWDCVPLGVRSETEAWSYISLRSRSVLFEETSELLFFSTSCDIRTIGGFFFWTNSRKPLYTLNKMNVRQVTATATGADDFGDSD